MHTVLCLVLCTWSFFRKHILYVKNEFYTTQSKLVQFTVFFRFECDQMELAELIGELLLFVCPT